MLSFQVHVELIYRQVDGHGNGSESFDEATAAHIRALNPRLIDWSNVPDYIPPATFAKIALAYSAPHTTHLLHSYHWVEKTYGARTEDYMGHLGEFSNELFEFITKNEMISLTWQKEYLA